MSPHLQRNTANPVLQFRHEATELSPIDLSVFALTGETTLKKLFHHGARQMTEQMGMRKNFGIFATLGQTRRGDIADTGPRKRDAQQLRVGG